MGGWLQRGLGRGRRTNDALRRTQMHGLLPVCTGAVCADGHAAALQPYASGDAATPLPGGRDSDSALLRQQLSQLTADFKYNLKVWGWSGVWRRAGASGDGRVSLRVWGWYGLAPPRQSRSGDAVLEGVQGRDFRRFGVCARSRTTEADCLPRAPPPPPTSCWRRGMRSFPAWRRS